MVFSSLEFLFIFLPFCVVCYYFLIRTGHGRGAIAFLFLASLLYYGYWKPINTLIIIGSIVLNYMFGQWIYKGKAKKTIFIFTVTCNLLALAYYKYTDFGIGTLNALLHTNIPLLHIILPIGISFFTFQQIAYLADIYNQKYNPNGERFLDYCCFVCFFPQLVAGPIVHHQEMMPQFSNEENHRVKFENIYLGLVMLSIGLAKKVFIADNLSPIVSHTFDVAETLTFMDALFGSLAYCFQLYFDFSGYSDMAIGCGLFFNIKLPQNFLSPYRSVNIQDFWQRWHITLSRWLRDYLYIPLGGNRHGTWRTMKNLTLTFLLGGLWHGAAWTFVLWGLMHGIALVIHRIWSKYWNKKMPAFFGWFLTFVFINMAWIVFRSADFDHVIKFIDAFAGTHGFYYSENYFSSILQKMGTNFSILSLYVLIIISFIISQLPYNSQMIMEQTSSRLWCSLMTGLILVVTFFTLVADKPTEFLYFQF